MNALVTGSTKGIGRAICLELAKEGYDLALTARSETELQDLAKSINSAFPDRKVIQIPADLSEKTSLHNFIFKVQKEFKTIDVLVMNAGFFQPSKMLAEKEVNFEKAINLNIIANYHLFRAFAPGMVEKKAGHIFTICSSASRGPISGAGTYSMTKFALHGLTLNMRAELKQHKVKVTGIYPGSTFTSSWEGTTIPQEKFIQPEDIAKVISNTLKLSESAEVEEVIINPIEKI